MAPPGAYEACIFDMDGVLADSMRQHHMAYVKVLEPYGVKPTREDVFRREGMNARNVIREILALRGILVDEAKAKRLGEEKQAAFRALGKPPVARGADRSLRALREAGLQVGLVTGSSHDNATHILGPLVGLFGAVVADGDYLRQKPHPEPYLVAARKLGVEPTRCVVVENAVLGVRSAVAAGMACIGLPTTMPIEALRDAGAHAIAATLEEAAGRALQGQGFKRP